jgi:hypothetical protein
MRLTTLAAAILTVLEGDKRQGGQIVDETRNLLALEGSEYLPRMVDFAETMFGLQHRNLINCPHAEQPVWSPVAKYRLTNEGRLALQRLQVLEMGQP